MACTKQSFRVLIDSIVGPVLSSTTNNPLSVTNHIQTFLNAMWNGYQTSGCSWFQNRVTHWQGILANVGNPNGAVAQRMLAKIEWAQQQHIACGCPGAPPMIVNPTSNTAKLVNEQQKDKIITGLDFDLNDIPAAGETRKFNVTGTKDAEFILEIKNESGYYYNFKTNTFTSTKASFERTIKNNKVAGSVVFPSIITTDTVNGAVSAGIKVVMDTVVANTMAVGDRVTGNTYLNANYVTVAALNPDGDNTSEFSLSEAVALDDGITLSFSGDNQYDVYVHAKPGTKHVDYIEKRFGDKSIDLNGSTGSRSLTMRKVIYQYTELLLTLSIYSPTGTTFTNTDDTIDVSRAKGSSKIPFTASATAASTKCFTIQRQPTEEDIIAFLTPVAGSTPEALPGENVYPSVSNTDTVDGAIVGGGSVVKVVMDTNVADKMAVGDKITIVGDAVLTDTVDGAVESGIKVVMDNNVATKMAIGDQITGNAAFDRTIVTVAALNPDGDNVKEFSMSEAIAIDDGTTLTFTPKCNRSLTTVVALNPDGDNAKEFSMSQNIGLRDGATLSFSNQMNYQWPVDNIDGIEEDMILVTGTNVTADSKVGVYRDTITLFENTERQEVIVQNEAPATTAKNQTPTVVKGLVTAQPGNIVFDKQQKLVLGGDTLKIGGYGPDQILRLYGYELLITDLELTLTDVTTTTTAASVNSTSVVVTARDGILNGTSTVSGIGIDSSSAIPTVSSGASAAGAGTIVLSAAQTLENGITLTFGGAGKTATITGNIEVIKAGTANRTLRFDFDKLLTSA